MKYVLFYSWQSDLPNNTNRGFLEEALRAATETAVAGLNCDLEVSVDRDTLGVSGAPDISATLLEKIRSCDAFVADVSIVTGDKANARRPAPNPNVLLELGYAVATVGWEKVILLFNEAYGGDEDLPFDIRQHRRIAYRLSPDEPKAPARKSLAGRLAPAIAALLARGKAPTADKRPVISVSWHHWPVEALLSESALPGERSKVLTLPASSDSTTATIARLRDEQKSLTLIDGAVDPQWASKLERFQKEASEFIDALKDGQRAREYFLAEHFDNALLVTLHVENEGTAAATDVRAHVALPAWLVALEKLPSRTIRPPVAPRPTPPETTPLRATAFALSPPPFSPLSNALLQAAPRTSACYLKERGVLHFWADRLLHKHSIFNARDRVYFVAGGDAPTGEHVLQGRSFAAEDDDWQDFSLTISVA